MAGTIREEIAGLRAGIAALGVQNARQQAEIDAIKRALKAEPSTNRAPRKVAEPTKAIKACNKTKADFRASGKGWKYHRSWCAQH